jgi:hypothetical protein
VLKSATRATSDTNCWSEDALTSYKEVVLLYKENPEYLLATRIKLAEAEMEVMGRELTSTEPADESCSISFFPNGSHVVVEKV